MNFRFLPAPVYDSTDPIWSYDFSIHSTCTMMSPTASSCSISVCGMKTLNWRRVVGHRVGMQEGCGGWAAFCSIADPPSTPCHGHGQALTVHLWHPTDDLSMNEDQWVLDGEGDAEGQAQDKFHKIWGNCFNKYCAQELRLMGQAGFGLWGVYDTDDVPFLQVPGWIHQTQHHLLGADGGE